MGNDCSEVNLNLILVLDTSVCPYDKMPSLIVEAVQGGVTAVQWRDKKLSDREFLAIAQSLIKTCHENKVSFWVNDRVDVAVAINADGIHLGQSDLPVSVARKIIPASMLIGLSAENIDDVKLAEHEDINYLAISPVFATTTKNDTAPAFGLDGLKHARRISRHRLIAIGGIHAMNAQQVRDAGADGLAVVSAIRSFFS